jgi:hypothetical protein
MHTQTYSHRPPRLVQLSHGLARFPLCRDGAALPFVPTSIGAPMVRDDYLAARPAANDAKVR